MEMVVGLNCVKRSKFTALVTVVLALALGTSTVALAAFSSSNSKILGVGRIQSAAPEAPIAVESRLQLDTTVDPSSVEQITTPTEREVVPAEPAPTTPATVSSDGSAVINSDWQIGRASGYDEGDAGVDQWTATGALFNGSSMGVAVPVEWSYLLGSTVEVEYNGIVVTAAVNDTGGFLRYGRALDLQPGVWKAFGFSTVHDWGVRTVRWRVVG
jgi:rare lipoprotein A (peptidoglycan hydrolase)